MIKNRKLRAKVGMVLFALSFTFQTHSQDLTSWLVGEVTDKDTSLPIPQMRVIALKVENQKVTASYQATTNSEGVYSMVDVPSGDYLIYVQPDLGYSSSVPNNTINVPSNRAGTEAVESNFSLEKGGGVSGIVTKQDGTPIQNVKIIAVLENGVSAEAITGQNGRFTIDGLTPTTDYILVATVEGFLDLFQEGISIQKNQRTEINFIFTTLNTLKGKISNSQGVPIPDADVVVYSESELGETISDAEGSYSISGLVADTYEIQAWGPGYSPTKISNIVISEGTFTQNIILEAASQQGGWIFDGGNSECLYAEKLYAEPKALHIGLPPGCCPCRVGGKLMCPDCPGGFWQGLTLQGQLYISVPVRPNRKRVGGGIERGFVVYQCGLGTKCYASVKCKIFGLIKNITGASIAAASIVNAPCIRDLEGRTAGVFTAFPAIGPIGPGGSIQFGLEETKTIYFELGAGFSVGIGGAFISCNTKIDSCDTPCKF